MANINEGSGIPSTNYAGTTGSSMGSTGDISTQASSSSASPSIGDMATQGREQVKRFGGMARDAVFYRADNQKKVLVQSIQGFLSTLENASKESDGSVKQVLDSATGYIRKFSDRIENGSSEELLQEAQTVVREKPAVFFAGCVAVGFLAARLFKV
jgi:hypothetical protein